MPILIVFTPDTPTLFHTRIRTAAWQRPADPQGDGWQRALGPSVITGLGIDMVRLGMPTEQPKVLIQEFDAPGS